VLEWPISIVSTVIVIFQMLSGSIQCLSVTNPGGRLAGTAGVILASLAIPFYFAMGGAWAAFSSKPVERFKFMFGIYAFFLFLCLAGAYQLYRYPSHLAEAIWGFAVLLLSIAALYMQHRGMEVEKRELNIP